MHVVLELGDVRVLGDVVDRGCGQAPAHLTPFLVVEIHVAVADVQETEARIVTGLNWFTKFDCAVMVSISMR